MSEAGVQLKRSAGRPRREPSTAFQAVEDMDNGIEHRRMSEAARTSWLLRDAKENEIRQFFKDIPLPEGLNQLSSARRNIELAAEILNDRINKEANEEVCTSCGGPPRQNGIFVMQCVEKDPDTGLNVLYRYCSVSCVRERNRRRLMPPGSPKERADGREFGDIG
jgi:hypothetical protein